MAECDAAAPALPRLSVASGAWAITDQGTFAAANFTLNVLLARWLTESAYGAFTISFTLFLLAGTLYTALVIEPMLVFGPGRYRSSLAGYFARLAQAHLLASAAFGLVLAAVGAALTLLDQRATGAPLLAFGLATPILLLQWFARRSVYVVARPDLGAGGGLVYLGAVIVGLLLLERRGSLNPVSAIWLVAVASALASVAIGRGLRRALSLEAGPGLRRAPGLASVLAAHWGYGRWAVGTAALTWLPGNVYFLALPLWTGLEATASLRALMNLYLPMMHAVVALGILAIPAFVRWRAGEDLPARVRRIAAWMIVAGLLYSVIIGVTGPALIPLLYADRYAGQAHLAWLLGLLPAAAAGAAVFGGGLRAIERPDRVFFAYAGGAGFTLTAGLTASARFGVPGASVGWSLAYALTALLLYRAFAGATGRGTPPA